MKFNVKREVWVLQHKSGKFYSGHTAGVIDEILVDSPESAVSFPSKALAAQNIKMAKCWNFTKWYFEMVYISTLRECTPKRYVFEISGEIED